MQVAKLEALAKSYEECWEHHDWVMGGVNLESVSFLGPQRIALALIKVAQESEGRFSPPNGCAGYLPLQLESQDNSLIATAVVSAQNCASLGLGHGAEPMVTHDLDDWGTWIRKLQKSPSHPQLVVNGLLK